MKAILQGFYQKEHFWLRLGVVLLAVFGMGFALSLLLLVDMGTDPCSMMSKAISTQIGMSFGNWQAMMNTVLLVLVVIFGGRNLGFGTLANMFLVGYFVDFSPGSGIGCCRQTFYDSAGSDRGTDSIGGTVYSDSSFIYGCGYGHGTVRCDSDHYLWAFAESTVQSGANHV